MKVGEELKVLGTPVNPTSNSSFRAVIIFRVDQENKEQGQHLQVRKYCECIKTGSGLTSVMYNNWGGKQEAVTKAGIFCDTGFKDLGWYQPGTKTSASGACWYYGGSGKEYRASVSGSYSAEQTQTYEYTVTFSGDGGSGAPEPIRAETGQSITIPTGKPTRTGYTFHGWKDGETIYQPGDAFTAEKDTTLTAYWTLIGYYLRYYVDGVEVTNHIKAYGQPIVIKSYIPHKDKYEFMGWSTDGINVTWKAGDIYTKNEPMKLYAVFRIIAQAYCKVNGQWKMGVMMAKKDGEWKEAKSVSGKSGTWKGTTV